MDKRRTESLSRPHNMSISTKVLSSLESNGDFLPLYEGSVREIAKEVPGWSAAYHYLFFLSVTCLPEVKSILMLGVYKGRDISFICDGAKDKELQIVGVDKFSDTPCEDWTPDQKTKSWTEAGFPDAPSLEVAQANTAKYAKPVHHLRLIQTEDELWLSSVTGKFDVIYCDTSHDKATVLRQLKQVRALCHENTLVCGDDYENIVPTWGVKDAVRETFKAHHVLEGGAIWFANAGDYR